MSRSFSCRISCCFLFGAPGLPCCLRPMTNVATIQWHATFHPEAYRSTFRQVPSIRGSVQVCSWSFNRPICRWLKRSTTPSARRVDQAFGERVTMATGKEPERRRERKLVTAVADAQDPPLALVCSSCRTPGLRLWPFIVSARNGHTFPFFFSHRLSSKFKLRPIYFSSAPPFPLFCKLNGPKNWENPLDFYYENAD